jgi:hypothetical protein
MYYTDGSIGIGTASPTMTLTVNAGGFMVGTPTSAGIYVSPTNQNTINGGYGLDSDIGDL